MFSQQQSDAAMEIQEEFEENPFGILEAKTQSGKTGCMLEFINKYIETKYR